MEARAYWIQIDGPDGYCFKLDGLTFELVGLLVRMLLVKRQFENARDACVSVDGNTHFSEEDMMQNGAHDSQPYRPRKLRVESLRVLERFVELWRRSSEVVSICKQPTSTSSSRS